MKLPHWLRRLFCSHAHWRLYNRSFYMHRLCLQCNRCLYMFNPETRTQLKCRTGHHRADFAPETRFAPGVVSVESIFSRI